MTERLKYIFDAVPACDTFADVACDHGYIAFEMLFSGKCNRAIVADISEKSLKKAENLLKDYVQAGKCRSFVSDGFDNVPKADCALIAGIGGTLIEDIICRATILPDTLVLQPMKHCDKVRRALVRLGFAVKKDFTVKAEGQFYDIIVANKGKDCLTDEEAEFGRTNIVERPQAFRDKIQEQIDKLFSYTERENIAANTRLKMLEKAERLKKYV